MTDVEPVVEETKEITKAEEAKIKRKEAAARAKQRKLDREEDRALELNRLKDLESKYNELKKNKKNIPNNIMPRRKKEESSSNNGSTMLVLGGVAVAAAYYLYSKKSTLTGISASLSQSVSTNPVVESSNNVSSPPEISLNPLEAGFPDLDML